MGITYIEGYGTFTDPHTIQWRGAKNKTGTITGNKFLIATGGRPDMGNTPGKELAISRLVNVHGIHGVSCACDGMGWHGMRWDGMGWDKLRWDVMECDEIR